jgi:SAM-dependent methyltransferase
MAEYKKILNFGCGTTRMEGAINIDHIKLPNVDIAFDFEKFPYPFENNSVDEIHMYFVLEHLNDHFGVIRELHRILKRKGRLYIRVPHFSSVYAWGEFTHKRGYAWGSFDIFGDFSGRSYYSDIRFKVVRKRIKYFLTYPYNWYKFNTWFPHWEKKWYGSVVKIPVLSIQFLIDLSPEIFERFWCYWVGGASEVYAILEKK